MGGELARQARGAAAGVAAAAGVGLALHALGARMAWYGAPWLLAPLFAGPGERSGRGGARPRRAAG